MAKPFEAYENLKEKFGKEQAKAIVEYVDTTSKQGLATKDDIHGLQLDISRLERKVEADISRLELKIEGIRTGLITEITNIKADLVNIKADLIKWMIGVGIGIVALLLSVRRFMGS
jgi:Protein of unknown function (DUF1640).